MKRWIKYVVALSFIALHAASVATWTTPERIQSALVFLAEAAMKVRSETRSGELPGR
jgi:hypothetical protein